MIAACRELVRINPLAQEHMQQWVSRIEISDPFKLADFAASMTTASASELQAVLEASDAGMFCCLLHYEVTLLITVTYTTTALLLLLLMCCCLAGG